MKVTLLFEIEGHIHLHRVVTIPYVFSQRCFALGPFSFLRPLSAGHLDMCPCTPMDWHYSLEIRAGHGNKDTRRVLAQELKKLRSKARAENEMCNGTFTSVRFQQDVGASGARIVSRGSAVCFFTIGLVVGAAVIADVSRIVQI